MNEVTPGDSRYVPMTQQPSCCVPTCLSIIMYKREIPLIAQEELGYHLGLVVSEENKHLFYNPRTGERPITSYGTQIYKEEFHPNNVFPKLGIPLRMIYHSIEELENEKELESFILKKIDQDADLLACFDHGELNGDHEQRGHVCVVDRMCTESSEIRLIDPQQSQPKWRTVKAKDLYEAMKLHGKDKMGGIWEFIRR